ncbi:MAG: dihydroorotate dehydrogenase-like protein [Actinomycetota bacterium]
MIQLHTEYLGLALRSPIVASAGPLTGSVDTLMELEQHGVGAVVLPSLFEEQVEHETYEIDRLFELHADSFLEAPSMFPELDDEASDERYLRLIEAARSSIDVPVIASLNGANVGGWVRYGRLLESAGASAIELNLYTVASDPLMSSAEVESEQLSLVALLADELTVPLAVKISPFYSSLGSFVVGLQSAGAAGVVMFNRFYQPDLDAEALDMVPSLSLSSSDDSRLPLRWAGLLRDHLSMSIAASSGVHAGLDAAKLLLAGADVVMMTSALLRNGTGHVEAVETELQAWMRDHEYESVGQLRGAARFGALADPAAYERANYIGNLATYTSRHLGRGPIHVT